MWFRDNPDLLQRELDALEKAGISYEVNDALAEADGVLEMTARVPVDGQLLDFVATYPDDFPYFKPVVHGPDLGYRHHVSPDGEYCLMRTGQGAWRIDDTLAWLLTEQMDKLVAVNLDAQAPATPGLEVPQAEPFTAYLMPKNPGEVLIVDSSLNPGENTSGSARLVYTSGTGETPIRGHLCFLRDASGTQVGDVIEPPVRADHRLGEVDVAWVQLNAEPRTNSPNDWWAAAEAVSDTVTRARQGFPGKPNHHQSRALQLVLVGFPEEIGHRTVGQGWVGLARQREKAGKAWSAPRFVRVEQAGHRDLYQREPRLAEMRTARIALIGLGGLGSHLVPLLGCMAPAHLWLVDNDRTNSATAVRNPGAFGTHGSSKAELAIRVVHATQPYTAVAASGLRIGAPRRPLAGHQQTSQRRAVPAEPESSIMDIFDDVDLIIDATADLNVQHFLSDAARNHRKAYLRVEALPGVRSGFLALQRPEASVCWMCWQHHLGSTIPALPAHEPDGGVQPPGCPDPTYTGAGFDLAALAAQAAQVVASYFTGADGYGRLPADVMTVRFVAEDGSPVPPQWETYDLSTHPACPYHQGGHDS